MCDFYSSLCHIRNNFKIKIPMNRAGRIHLLLGGIVCCTGVCVCGGCVQGQQGRGGCKHNFLDRTSGRDTWHTKLVQQTEPRQGNTPAHFNCSPKACWVSGKLIWFDLWLKKGMQSQGKGKQAASRQHRPQTVFQLPS